MNPAFPEPPPVNPWWLELLMCPLVLCVLALIVVADRINPPPKRP